jgi:hypothetical protein
VFSIPPVNVIESDEGFSVEVLGRSGLRYVQGDRSLRIDSEVLARPSGMALYSASVNTWNAPHSEEPISATLKAQIVESIRRAFRFQGFDIEVF